jgi:hypothetical protein
MSDLGWKPLLNPQRTAERFLAESDDMPRGLSATADSSRRLAGAIRRPG